MRTCGRELEGQAEGEVKGLYARKWLVGVMEG
jgi:hypothetical protein